MTAHRLFAQFVQPMRALGSIATLLLIASPLVGQGTARAGDAEATSRAPGPKPFRIQAQPLPAALLRFKEQAGVTLSGDSVAPASIRSNPVLGSYEPATALRTLLIGTGVGARFLDDTTAVLFKTVDAPQKLAGIEVTAARSTRSSYTPATTTSATKTDTPLLDVPQSVSTVTHALAADQAMLSMADVVRYIPGVTMGQGEGNRDQPTIRGNSTSANFFVDGIRDDVQYFRDLYNIDRVEALKGSNALIFGRGVGGGILNRVTKDASWVPVRDLTLRGGSYGTKRGELDVGQGLSERVAFRFNGVYENSDQFRRGVNLKRYGINPTATFLLGGSTRATASFEHFHDDRTADRGVPSFQGFPAPTDVRTFFGDPNVSYATARVDLGQAGIEHVTAGGVTLRNRTRFADYDKFYQNVYPGAVNQAGTTVALNGYNNSAKRTNLFNQSELVAHVGNRGFNHTLLAGFEVGRQVTDNFRNSAFFDNTATSLDVPFDDPTVSHPVTFRQAATDADNHVATTILALYAQDQIQLGRRWELVAGLRYERFDLSFHNRRNDQDLSRTDEIVSPRAGLVFKATPSVSLYGSFGTSALPSSGDQFSSLTATTSTLAPERFTNYEVGAKWEVARSLMLTVALYQLDRTNTSAPDPNDPSKVVQTGSQRTRGVELGASGWITRSWQIAGGYTDQDAWVTSRTAAAAADARVALVPRHLFSLWNRYQIVRNFGVGVGAIYQDRMFAAIDNTVTLPGYTRFDAATFFQITQRVGAQINVENVFDKRYFATANSNNNISPGAPRSVRISLNAGF